MRELEGNAYLVIVYNSGIVGVGDGEAAIFYLISEVSVNIFVFLKQGLFDVAIVVVRSPFMLVRCNGNIELAVVLGVIEEAVSVEALEVLAKVDGYYAIDTVSIKYFDFFTGYGERLDEANIKVTGYNLQSACASLDFVAYVFFRTC